MVYDGGDSFPFDFEPIGLPFGSKSKGKLSPRSYPIQCESKWKCSFLSVVLWEYYLLFNKYIYIIYCSTNCYRHTKAFGAENSTQICYCGIISRLLRLANLTFAVRGTNLDEFLFSPSLPYCRDSRGILWGLHVGLP